MRDTGVISLGGAAAETSAEVSASQRYTDNSGCQLSVLEYRMRAGGIFAWLFGGAGRSAVVVCVAAMLSLTAGLCVLVVGQHQRGTRPIPIYRQER